MRLPPALDGSDRPTVARNERRLAANRRPVAVGRALHPARIARTVSLLVAMAALFLPCGLGAETLCVQSDFNTIQEAIDAASDGDTILVEPGFYFENIDFSGKAISLRSTDGPEATTLDGSQLTRGPDLGSVVTFSSGEDPESVLEGFTITGGNGTLFRDDAGDFRLGGGVLCIAATPTITGNVVTGNTGGSIYLIDSSAVLTDLLVTRNSAAVGGGVRLKGSGDLTLTNCTLANNVADYGGGGVSIDQSDAKLRLEGCTITGNSAGVGGGAVLSFGPLDAVGCTFEANEAGFGGGAVVLGATGCFDSCSFSDNSALVGGAVAMGAGPVLELGRCVFFANEAVDAGGVVYVEAWDIGEQLVEFFACTLVENSGESGAVIHIEDLGSASVSTALVTFHDSILWSSGDGLFEENAGTVEASYSLIEGSYDGDGNLDEDPLFVDAENGDFRLTKESPCVDAGDPESPLDADGTTADMGAFPFIQYGFFRGDVDGNGETFALLDALAILDWQFGTGEEPPCMDAADADDNGSVSAILEALYLLQWQFTEGPFPPDPGPDVCGLDATDDSVDCATTTECP